MECQFWHQKACMIAIIQAFFVSACHMAAKKKPLVSPIKERRCSGIYL